jgi:hypothetical protein
MISASSSLPSRLFLRKNIASEGELHTSVDDSRVEFNGDGCADDLAEEARWVWVLQQRHCCRVMRSWLYVGLVLLLSSTSVRDR